MINSLFDITGKVVIITGGTGVLGGSIAEYLIKHGCKVVIVSRNQNKINRKIAEMGSQANNIMGFSCDVLNRVALRHAREEIINKWGRIDVLVNAAGGNLPGATLGEDQSIFDMKIDDFQKVTDLNMNGTVYPSLVFGERMAEQRRGSIINMSSMATLSAITRVPGYSIAKSGIDIFTKWFAMELGIKFGEGVRVNALAPGFFIGDQNRNVLINPDGSHTERTKKILARTIMKRFGHIDELNGAIHFLCSEAASFITGAIIPVDGGFSSYSGV